jgi:hypothetical protein
VLFYGVVSDSIEEAVELFPTREEAEAIVQAWDRDEPQQAGALHVERVELVSGGENQAGKYCRARAEGRTAPNLGGLRMKATEGDEIRYQREYLTDAGPVPRGLPGTCLCS